MAGHDIETQPELMDFFRLITEWDFDKWVDWVGNWGISRALFVSMIFVGLFAALGNLIPNLGVFTFSWLVGTAPIWLPIVLIVAAWRTWKLYILALFLSKLKTIVLEMKVPRDITRSPRAMELAFNALWVSSGETQFIYRHWRGSVRPFYSFEIASFGGDVHFYIWCREVDKTVMEHAIYAYYPEIELHEVEDYASKFQYNPQTHAAFATDHVYARSDAYPIKTYIDFELDKDPKEEFKVDPFASVIEYLSNLNPHEQAWVQIILTYSKEKRKKPGKWFETESRWEGIVRDEVKKIRKAASLNPGKEDAPDSDERKYGFPRPTWAEQESMKSMERQLGKLPFNVGIRAVYFAEKRYFQGASYNGVRWLWRPMNNPGYQNMLRPKHWHNTLDYPWQDFGGFRYELMTRRFLDAFRRRSYFYPPYPAPHYMMTPETLATLWHPPSRAISSPGVQRIPATKAEPPNNLPR